MKGKEYGASVTAPVRTDYLGFRECARLASKGLTIYSVKGEAVGASVLSVAKLGLKRGDVVTAVVKAPDKEEAARTLARVIDVLKGEEGTDWERLLPLVVEVPQAKGKK